jgi:hypothetical protein
MVTTLKTVEKMWGVKHPESRDLAEKLYGELTQQILMRKAPEQMGIRKAEFMPHPNVVKDS